MKRQTSSNVDSPRSRVHSAPPTENRKSSKASFLPPLAGVAIQIEKPTTPDPEKVRLILEQRISQALAGPSTILKAQKSSNDGLTTRRASLQRSSAITSQEMTLVPIDANELSMLRSINRNQQDGDMNEAVDDLYKHEYQDESDDEMEALRNRRKSSMVRQDEQEGMDASLAGVRLKPMVIKNSESRLSGYRHEKMRSSTKSGDLSVDQISGLVYDIDFDCYYNPKTDTYYRLMSHSKSGESSFLMPKEIL
ncbi:unnamed protein product [Caenorhabditis bovis]|uniref:Uncharacterized protein n=1 Tax=Caenorhabditis bovis TaxID=2654633 RepID=A0A8S1EU24_9PELO|nr:unnamed protein product [Caenorhabditis bovis]